MAEPWLLVIGMGDDGLQSLSPKARAALERADHLFSGERLFALIPDDGRPRTLWQSPLKNSLPDLQAARAAGQTICVIATGDPLSYGIGNWLLRQFPSQQMIIIPGVSAFALACARLAWPQHEVHLITLHGRPDTAIRDAIAPNQRIIALSEDAGTPTKICHHLVEMGYPNSHVTVLAHLDGVRERRFDTIAQDGPDLFDETFSQDNHHDLNVVAIQCVSEGDTQPRARAAGLADESFAPFGKMTKRELRALAIARLAPQPDDCLWDVGAGSGSVSIEFLRLSAHGCAVLFDIDPATRAVQMTNLERFGLSARARSVTGPIPGSGEQPAIAPDAIFLGGGLDETAIAAALLHLRTGGRLVAHAVTLQSEMVLHQAHQTHGGDLTRIDLARATPVRGSAQFDALQPAMTVTQWAFVKGKGENS